MSVRYVLCTQNMTAVVHIVNVLLRQTSLYFYQKFDEVLTHLYKNRTLSQVKVELADWFRSIPLGLPVEVISKRAPKAGWIFH